ncbi:hypothetical protein ACOMHN_013593 [Nucella lapillus]
MAASTAVNSTGIVEAAYYILLEGHAQKRPEEMTSKTLKDTDYVISENGSFLQFDEFGGNFSNVSQRSAPTFNEVSLMKAVVFGVMFVISFVGNTATLAQMYRLRRRKSTINTLIVNLAIADLLVTFFCIAGEGVWSGTVQWLAGNITCKVVKYMQPIHKGTKADIRQTGQHRVPLGTTGEKGPDTQGCEWLVLTAADPADLTAEIALW